MTALVTGATGFIGGHLVATLAQSGEEVRCLVRRPGPADSPKAARYHVADFSTASLGLSDAVFANVDTVYHVAGATRATSSAAFHEANVAVTERLLGRVVRGGGKPRFVYISSQAAAGPSRDRPLTEDDPPSPIEAYGRSKLAAENIVLGRSHEIPVTILRPVAVYGPGDRDFLSIFRLLRRGLAVYPGIRDAVVTTIYIDDLVRGIIAAAGSPRAAGRTYFIGNAEFTDWRTIYRTAARVIGRESFREIDVPLSLVRVGGLLGDLVGRVTRRPPLLSSGKAALAAPRSWTCSSDRAKRDFAFVANTPLLDGMRATHDHYLASGWL